MTVDIILLMCCVVTILSILSTALSFYIHFVKKDSTGIIQLECLNGHLDQMSHSVNELLQNVRIPIESYFKLLHDTEHELVKEIKLLKEQMKEIKEVAQESIDLNRTAFSFYIAGGKDKELKQKLSDKCNFIKGIVPINDEKTVE